MVAPAGAVVSASPTAMPATCVAWKDARVDGQPACAALAEPGVGARDDHLRRRPLEAALREPDRVLQPAGLKKRLPLSIPSSTIPILIPSPFMPVGTRTGWRRSRPAAVRVLRVRHGRMNPVHVRGLRSAAAWWPGRRRSRRAGSGSAPGRADGIRPLELRDGARLRLLDRGQVRGRARRLDVEVPRRPGANDGAAAGGGEAGHAQRRDDAPAPCWPRGIVMWPARTRG